MWQPQPEPQLFFGAFSDVEADFASAAAPSFGAVSFGTVSFDEVSFVAVSFVLLAAASVLLFLSLGPDEVLAEAVDPDA